MGRYRAARRTWLGLLVLPLATAVVAQAPAKRTPLDDYIEKKDSSYAWKVEKTIPGDGVTTYVVDLASQTWLTPKDVDRTLWKHWLLIAKPEGVTHKTAFVRVTGGKNGDGPPDKAPAEIALMAKETRSVIAELKMIPNQPLVFHGDGQPRFEDDLIGYCWDQFLKTGRTEWLPRLPMTKSVVRAMDTVTALLGSQEGGNVPIETFFVAGGSKRGWTTWITAAVDKRVIGIAPVVIDIVNVRPSMEHHFSAYGFWAPAVGDYVHHKITNRHNTKEYAALLGICDPYAYRDRLTMPKYIVNASGDEFFLPDSSQFYFDDLEGPKFLRYVPNANHSLKGSDALQTITAFYQTLIENKPFPRFRFQNKKDGTIRVETTDPPVEVNLWQATNPKARDFRLESIGPAYTKQTLPLVPDGVYVASVPTPSEGWTAYFVEVVYKGPGHFPLKFTTQVSVAPDRLPHSIEEYNKSLSVK